MRRIVIGLATGFFSLTLWADTCPGGEFWTEEASPDPQVDFTVKNIEQWYESPDDDEIGGHTVCEEYYEAAQEVYAISYTTQGVIREVRRLSIGDGMDNAGTTCTTSGIYRFTIIAPLLHGMYDGVPPATPCCYSFVHHNQNCPAQGVLIATESPEYEEAISEDYCNSSLAQAIEEAQDADYQDPVENDADTPVDGDIVPVDGEPDNVVTDIDGDVAPIDSESDMSVATDNDIIVDSGVNFDIPPEATDWPDGREKHYCGCPQDKSYDYQNGNPFYYLIKVQNWGFVTAKHVRVIDHLAGCNSYIRNSTEIATILDGQGNGLDWKLVPDMPATEENKYNWNLFLPLSGEGLQVADQMVPCDQQTLICADTRFIRFKVALASGCPKGVSFWDLENTAQIIDGETSTTYFTNNNSPLLLKYVNGAGCSEPPKSQCGGGGDIVSDDDSILTDEDTTTPDADLRKPKNDGCGCTMVF